MARPTSIVPTKPPDDAQVLLLEEVAWILRISVTSVRRLVIAGKPRSIPVTVGGGVRRVLRQTLEEYIRATETGLRESNAAEKPMPNSVRHAMLKAGWDGQSRLVKEGHPKKKQ